MNLWDIVIVELSPERTVISSGKLIQDFCYTFEGFLHKQFYTKQGSEMGRK